MKIKCDDGKIRRFRISHYTGCPIEDYESKCLECGELFGFHDTKVLKPIWRKHICKKHLN